MATAKKKSAAKPAPRVAPMKAADAKDLTAKAFITKLKTFQSDDELRKIKGYFKSGEGQYGHGDTFIGVRMGTLFALAKSKLQERILYKFLIVSNKILAGRTLA